MINHSYEKSNRPNKKQTSSPKKRITALLAIILILLVLVLIYEAITKILTHNNQITTKQIPASNIIKNTAQAPTYEFYKILPSSDALSKNQKKILLNLSPGKDSVATSNFQYILQIASVTNAKKANSLANKINILVKAQGTKAIVDQTKHNSTTHYRVRLGPYKSLFDAEKIQDLLDQNKLPGMIMATKLEPNQN